MRYRSFEIAIAVGVALIPQLASASDQQHCYLRDATSPTTTSAFLLCEQGLVYSTTNNGVAWNSFDTGASVTLHAIAFVDPTHGIVAGDDGTILATDDGGKTWKARPTGTKEHLLTIFTLGEQAWAGGFDGTILHSSDSGHTWTPQTSGTSMALESVYFLNPTLGWAVGWSGAILRTEDGGKTWKSVQSSAASWSLAAVRFFDEKSGWAVGFSGQLLHSKDGGLTWEAQKSESQSWLTSIARDQSKRLWIAGDEQFLFSDDEGLNWHAVPSVSNFFVLRVFPVGNSMWALAELGVLHPSGTGAEWKHDERFVPVGARIATSLEDTPTTGKSDH